MSQKALELAKEYVLQGTFTRRLLETAHHAAVAVVSRCDLVLTWNLSPRLAYPANDVPDAALVAAVSECTNFSGVRRPPLHSVLHLDHGSRKREDFTLVRLHVSAAQHA